MIWKQKLIQKSELWLIVRYIWIVYHVRRTVPKSLKTLWSWRKRYHTTPGSLLSISCRPSISSQAIVKWNIIRFGEWEVLFVSSSLLNSVRIHKWIDKRSGVLKTNSRFHLIWYQMVFEIENHCWNELKNSPFNEKMCFHWIFIYSHNLIT